MGWGGKDVTVRGFSLLGEGSIFQWGVGTLEDTMGWFIHVSLVSGLELKK